MAPSSHLTARTLAYLKITLVARAHRGGCRSRSRAGTRSVRCASRRSTTGSRRRRRSRCAISRADARRAIADREPGQDVARHGPGASACSSPARTAAAARRNRSTRRAAAARRRRSPPGAGDKSPVALNATGDALLLTTRIAPPVDARRRRRWRRRRSGGRGGSYSVLSVADSKVTATEHHRPPGLLRRRQVAGLRGPRRRRLQADGRQRHRSVARGRRSAPGPSGSRPPRSRPTARASPTS